MQSLRENAFFYIDGEQRDYWLEGVERELASIQVTGHPATSLPVGLCRERIAYWHLALLTVTTAL